MATTYATCPRVASLRPVRLVIRSATNAPRGQTGRYRGMPIRQVVSVKYPIQA